MQSSYFETSEAAIKAENRNVFLVFVAVLVLIIGVGALFLIFAANRTADFESVEHTTEVLTVLVGIENHFRDADIEGRDGILRGAERPETAIERRLTREYLEKFRSLTTDSPRQQNNHLRMMQTIDRRFATVDFLTAMSKADGLAAATTYMRANFTMNELRDVSNAISTAQNEEQELLRMRYARSLESRSGFGAMGTAAVILLMVIWGLSYYLINRYMKAKTHAALKFRQAFENARSGKDGMLEIPQDLAEQVYEYISEQRA